MTDLYRANFDQLFTGLANFVGDDSLALSEQGSLFCELNGVPFSFHHAPVTPTLFILAHAGNLGELPFEVQVDAMRQTLDANTLWQGSAGGSFGLDDADNLLLSYRLDLPGAPLAEDDAQALLPELLAQLAGAALWAQDIFARALGQLDAEA
jgi:hypothetical protein